MYFFLGVLHIERTQQQQQQHVTASNTMVIRQCHSARLLASRRAHWAVSRTPYAIGSIPSRISRHHSHLGFYTTASRTSVGRHDISLAWRQLSKALRQILVVSQLYGRRLYSTQSDEKPAYRSSFISSIISQVLSARKQSSPSITDQTNIEMTQSPNVPAVENSSEDSIVVAALVREERFPRSQTRRDMMQGELPIPDPAPQVLSKPSLINFVFARHRERDLAKRTAEQSTTGPTIKKYGDKIAARKIQGVNNMDNQEAHIEPTDNSLKTTRNFYPGKPLISRVLVGIQVPLVSRQITGELSTKSVPSSTDISKISFTPGITPTLSTQTTHGPSAMPIGETKHKPPKIAFGSSWPALPPDEPKHLPPRISFGKSLSDAARDHLSDAGRDQAPRIHFGMKNPPPPTGPSIPRSFKVPIYNRVPAN